MVVTVFTAIRGRVLPTASTIFILASGAVSSTRSILSAAHAGLAVAGIAVTTTRTILSIANKGLAKAPRAGAGRKILSVASTGLTISSGAIITARATLSVAGKGLAVTDIAINTTRKVFEVINTKPQAVQTPTTLNAVSRLIPTRAAALMSDAVAVTRDVLSSARNGLTIARGAACTTRRVLSLVSAGFTVARVTAKTTAASGVLSIALASTRAALSIVATRLTAVRVTTTTGTEAFPHGVTAALTSGTISTTRTVLLVANVGLAIIGSAVTKSHTVFSAINARFSCATATPQPTYASWRLASIASTAFSVLLVSRKGATAIQIHTTEDQARFTIAGTTVTAIWRSVIAVKAFFVGPDTELAVVHMSTTGNGTPRSILRAAGEIASGMITAIHMISLTTRTGYSILRMTARLTMLAMTVFCITVTLTRGIVTAIHYPIALASARLTIMRDVAASFRQGSSTAGAASVAMEVPGGVVAKVKVITRNILASASIRYSPQNPTPTTDPSIGVVEDGDYLLRSDRARRISAKLFLAANTRLAGAMTAVARSVLSFHSSDERLPAIATFARCPQRIYSAQCQPSPSLSYLPHANSYCNLWSHIMTSESTTQLRG
ncbi:uncharacterized protein FIBRA_09025 [Fibroporia radiculosa]|uniref:Uncharacterized protein n=1 Tax=Fibroporia radiculosa TaxID=599839 RepID=J4ICN7_9APHY|nr:uncharacterized protein FIBRA_09025 [Fibroporia radiculosa]CCM06731.1 predicted protein [Fibroporia radiculosa]